MEMFKVKPGEEERNLTLTVLNKKGGKRQREPANGMFLLNSDERRENLQRLQKMKEVNSSISLSLKRWCSLSALCDSSGRIVM